MARSNKYKLLLPDTMAQAGWDVLKEHPDFEAAQFSHTLPPEAFRALLGDVHGVALGGTPFRAPEIEAAPVIKAVARLGVGYDAVDVAALSRRKVPLFTTGIANSPSVAEQALFFMLALAKRAAGYDADVRQGRWSNRLNRNPLDLLGKTVLVVGFGRIGSRTAARCLAMEMQVLVYDPHVGAAAIRAAGCEKVDDLDAALPRADFLTLHCPKTNDTVGLIGAARLKLMKPGAFLVNTARGGIVEETALHAALISGRLAGAGLDVFDPEPPLPDNPLFKLDTVIFAPHMAGVTIEASNRMAARSVRSLIEHILGRSPREFAVNPEALD